MNLVASVTWRPAASCPTRRSLAPLPYISAVSMRSTPPATEASNASDDSVSPAPPYTDVPQVMAPTPNAETSIPERPSGTRLELMATSLPRSLGNVRTEVPSTIRVLSLDRQHQVDGLCHSYHSGATLA